MTLIDKMRIPACWRQNTSLSLPELQVEIGDDPADASEPRPPNQLVQDAPLSGLDHAPAWSGSADESPTRNW